MKMTNGMKFLKVTRLAALLSMGFCLEAFSAARESVTGDLYVDAATGLDTNSGRTWDAAFASIQKAIDVAVAGETIVVNDGTYQPINSADKKIVIRSVNGTATTVIDGGKKARCATLGTTANTTLAGFMLTNGQAEYGGGACYGYLTNCVLSGNVATGETDFSVGGGGSYYSNLDDCTLTGNSAKNYRDGGGSYGGVMNRCRIRNNSAAGLCGGSYKGVLNHCEIKNNSDTGFGRGEANYCLIEGNSGDFGGGANYATLNNCIVKGNSAAWEGGGVYGGTATGCLIINNRSTYSGGGSHMATLENCTIYGNRAGSGWTGGGAYFGDVRNCIITGNSGKDGGNWYGSRCQYTCTSPLPDGPGNLNVDPQYNDAANGDFHLKNSSPCVDVGTNVVLDIQCDIDGNARICNGIIDMGAYELQPWRVEFCSGDHGVFENGSDVQILSAYEGDTVAAPVVYSKVGWKFLGWDKDFSCVTQDMVVTALYEEKYCNIMMTNPYGEEVHEVVGYGTNYTFIAPSPYVAEPGVREYACCGTSYTAPTIKPTFTKIITNDLAFTWDVWITNAVYEVVSGKPVKIDVEWTKTYFGTMFDKLTKDAQIDMLNQVMGNGYTAWQSYVIGLDPTDDNSKVELDAPQNQSADKIEIVLENVLPPPGSGYTVKIEAEKDGTKIPGGTTFTIDLNSSDDPTGLYEFKINLVADGSTDAAVTKTLSQTVGVLKGVSAKVKTAIAVPWDAMSGAGVHSISISNIVKTASLDIGDKLYVYDKSGKKYETWELGLDKTWKPVATYVVNADGTISKTSSGAPESTEVARGSAIWLERQDVTKPYYLYGQFNQGAVSTVIDAGTTADPMWNLVASPLLEPFDLADIPLSDGTSAGARNGDEIILSTESGPRTYTLKSGQWGYDVNTVEQRTMPDGTKIDVARKTRNTSDTTIPVGAGFWYVSHGGNPVIVW